MNIWNIIFTSFFIIWLFVIACLLWRIQDQNMKRSEKLENALISTILMRLDSMEARTRDVTAKTNDLTQKLSTLLETQK